MSTPPKAIRQIGEHKWMAGIHNILSNNEMKDQIVCWHETGWVYSMHLVNTIENEKAYSIKVNKDVYKLNVYPGEGENILQYIISDVSNEFKISSRIITYIHDKN